jgi:hypothetical protein
MDPNIWGPQVWKLFNAVAIYADKLTLEGKTEHQELTVRFFNIMSFLLPCKYCRLSYSKFLMEIPLIPSCKFVQWVWTLHEKVNDKLQKPPNCRLRFKQFQQRIASYSTFIDANDLFDICYILAINYEGATADPLKFQYLYQFFIILATVLPQYEFRQVFLKSPIKKETVTSRDKLINWIYYKQKGYNQKHRINSGRFQFLDKDTNNGTTNSRAQNDLERPAKIIASYKDYYSQPVL